MDCILRKTHRILQYPVISRILTYALSLLLLVRCAESKPDQRLAEIDRIIEESPETALGCLDSIEPLELSEYDRQYLDFLKVKAKDKAFVTHTSDSLILKAIDYFSKHDRAHIYPEVLYYAGRVYSDLGDRPTALDYFQTSLEKVRKDNQDTKLEGKILAQISENLHSLRLYEEAITYVEESIRLDSIGNDSVLMVYDLFSLGGILLDMGRYDKAEHILCTAKNLAERTAPNEIPSLDMLLAATKFHKGEVDSALCLIRPVLKNLDHMTGNTALAYACDIYHKADIPDTALIYARMLINGENPANRNTAYEILLSPEMESLIPSDSIIAYAHAYRDNIERLLDRNVSAEAIIQNSLYNYSIHEREKAKAVKRNATLTIWLGSVAIFALGLLTLTLFLRNRNKSQLLKLHEAIDTISELRYEIKQKNKKGITDSGNFLEEKRNETDINDWSLHKNLSPGQEDLKNQLRENIMALYEANRGDIDIPNVILSSEAYNKLKDKIKNGQIISHDNEIWTKLENVVTSVAPDFKKRITLLAGGKLKPIDMQMALLIKCGIKPTEMSGLAGRSKSTIAYRRKELAKRLFGKELSLETIDSIIRLL